MTSTQPRPTTTQALPGRAAAAPLPRPLPPAPDRRHRLAGRWRHDRATGAWAWSREMRALHGLPAGATPSTETMVAAQHAADRPRTLEALAAAVDTAQAFCLEVRLRVPGDRHRRVLLLGEPVIDADGRVTAVEGMVLESPPAAPAGDRLQELETELAQLRTAMASRAPIEQAKGVLMLLTGCAEQAAFDLLAHISSHTHRKVRDVALDLVASASGRQPLPAGVREILRDACPPGAPGH